MQTPSRNTLPKGIPKISSAAYDWINPTGFRAVCLAAAIVSMIGGVAVIVYEAGGTAYVWIQLMSFPLLFAALFFKLPGGVVAGVLGGLALGPLMPLYVPQGIPQQPYNWLFRLAAYVFFGGFSGLLFKWLNAHHLALEKARSELSRSLDALQQTQLQLIDKARLESVGRLAAGVAHEVKNPLAVIQLGVDYLNLSLCDNDAYREVAGEMENAVARADRVIKGLLDFSRAERLELEPTDLNGVIRDSLQLVKHELLKKQIAVQEALGPQMPSLPLDQNRMKQVFINLFVNAVHAMQIGGHLSVQSSPVALSGEDFALISNYSDRFRVDEPVVMVAVEDDGCGIPREKLDRLFEPFFTTKPAGEGTGLGLSVTRKIMDLHGGAITIRNRPEGGVRVCLYFKTEGGA